MMQSRPISRIGRSLGRTDSDRDQQRPEQGAQDYTRGKIANVMRLNLTDDEEDHRQTDN